MFFVTTAATAAKLMPTMSARILAWGKKSRRQTAVRIPLCALSSLLQKEVIYCTI